MTRIITDSLRESVNELLCSWRIPQNQANIITDTIVYAHTHEKHTHGITRLPIYKKKIDHHLMSVDTQIQLISDTPVLSVLDCNNGFGQIAAFEGMKQCIHKAKNFGLSAAFIRNSNNFGVAGYFAEMAAKRGMLGIVITSSGPALTPPNGLKTIFGTNPFACAFPVETENIVLDMSMSEAARGKIRLAEKNGEKIPFGWAVDKNGNPTNNPTAALGGNLLAIGGVKGFGLALVIDYIAGLLSGSAFGGDIKPLAAEDGYSRHGHMLLVIDIEQLIDKEEYLKKIRTFVANIKSCGAPGTIILPGENSHNKAMKNQKEFDLNDKQIQDYNTFAKNAGLTKLLEVVERE